MDKKKIYAIALSVIALLCVASFIWAWFVTKEIRNKAEVSLDKGQKIIINNLVLTETKDEQIFWELYAKSGIYGSDSGLVVLYSIVGNFYDEEGKVVLSFESKKGSYKESDKRMVLEGDSLIVAEDGSSIIADKIIFKGKNDDIVATGNVRINRNDELITHSEQAIFNSTFTYFRIDGKSKVNIYDGDIRKTSSIGSKK